MQIEIKNKQWIIISLILLVVVLTLTIGGLIGQIQVLKQSTIVQTDTIVDTQIIETIKTEIVEKEKEIVRYKTQVQYEKDSIKNIDDSSAIKLFFELINEPEYNFSLYRETKH